MDSIFRAFEPVVARILPAPDGVFPRMIAVVLVLLLAWLIASGARWATNHAGRIEWLERLLTRSGVLSGLVEPSLASPRRFAGELMYWCIFLAGFSLALATWSESLAVRLGNLLLVVLPNSILAAFLILGASWLGRYWSRSVVIWMSNEGIAQPWRWAAAVRIATIAAGIALASELTGFATALVRPSFLIVLAGCTFGFVQAAIPVIRLHLASLLAPEDRGLRRKIEDPFSR